MQIDLSKLGQGIATNLAAVLGKDAKDLEQLGADFAPDAADWAAQLAVAEANGDADRLDVLRDDLTQLKLLLIGRASNAGIDAERVTEEQLFTVLKLAKALAVA